MALKPGSCEPMETQNGGGLKIRMLNYHNRLISLIELLTFDSLFCFISASCWFNFYFIEKI